MDFTKRKCSMKRLKYEYKTNILPYIHVCMKWTIKNYRLAATGLDFSYSYLQ